DPAFRRQGIGTLLMKEIIDRFKKKEVKTVRLEVRKSNLGAQLFYKKLGFLERGEMPLYYEDGESAIAMELSLE
ncbi:MAG: GNAT family N-acetyltransferase, partial [Hadesarchaea archaeon]|nr:GNAT family N-acetyltransferase [Hadesarchaea archaeon]